MWLCHHDFWFIPEPLESDLTQCPPLSNSYNMKSSGPAAVHVQKPDLLNILYIHVQTLLEHVQLCRPSSADLVGLRNIYARFLSQQLCTLHCVHHHLIEGLLLLLALLHNIAHSR